MGRQRELTIDMRVEECRQRLQELTSHVDLIEIKHRGHPQTPFALRETELALREICKALDATFE